MTVAGHWLVAAAAAGFGPPQLAAAAEMVDPREEGEPLHKAKAPSSMHFIRYALITLMAPLV